jgi:hypothetical protein
LAGVRVVELGTFPPTSALLADTRADVVSVKHPHGENMYRAVNTVRLGSGADAVVVQANHRSEASGGKP